MAKYFAGFLAKIVFSFAGIFIFYYSEGKQINTTPGFIEFVNNFKTINYDPQSGFRDIQVPDNYAFENTLAFNEDRIIENEYRDEFILKNLHLSIKHRSKENDRGFSDFIQSKDLNCFYYGKLQHPNSKKIVCLIIAMQNDSAAFWMGVLTDLKT